MDQPSQSARANPQHATDLVMQIVTIVPRRRTSGILRAGKIHVMMSHVINWLTTNHVEGHAHIACIPGIPVHKRLSIVDDDELYDDPSQGGNAP